MGLIAPRVLLLSMPWTTLTQPSLGLAILKARLREDGISCRVRHLNIFLLKYMKASSYGKIADLYAFNDFLFTYVLDSGEAATDQLAALRKMVCEEESQELAAASDLLNGRSYAEYSNRLRNCIVPQYLVDCMEVVNRSRATMVGFTCLFDQTVASLALAKLIKDKHPEKLIVFGGYAIERPVGAQILRSFPFVDAIATGEGEDKITSLARASVHRQELQSIPGVLCRDGKGKVRSTMPTLQPVDLDQSPMPDYDDWLCDVDELKRTCQVSIRSEVLPVETSRGCWWGQVSHCVFCGIDDNDMRYRVKSPAKAKEMLSALAKRYRCRSFRFSDYILPRSYYKTLLPDLANDGAPYSLHWEMKSNVKVEDVRVMNRAGVRYVQPGIESFSPSVLTKMSKGVTAIQNVLTIKLLMEHGIHPLYNILYGFPGDELYEYQEMNDLIPLLYHLPPTETCMPVLTVRYAPMSENPQRFGVTRPIVARSRYALIFSQRFREEKRFDLNDYCYIYETPYGLDPELIVEYERLRSRVARWCSLYESGKCRLSYEISASGIEFFDSRFEDGPRIIRFGPEHARVYNSIVDRIALRRHVVQESGIGLAKVNSLLHDFAREQVTWEEGDKVLGLGVRAAYYRNPF